jgi:LPXTG-motif cell wall-anchored protein
VIAPPATGADVPFATGSLLLLAGGGLLAATRRRRS